MTNEYFQKARLWADDNYRVLSYSRNRYQAAFVLSMLLNLILALVISVLGKLQTTIPIAIHHYDNGIVTVEPVKNNLTISKAQIESDLVRYITNREAYDVSSYRAQFDLVNLLSSQEVSSEYLQEHAKHNKTAPINTLGLNFSRKVHIYSINFLDSVTRNEKDLTKNHQNLAEVVLALIDSDKRTNSSTKTHYNALVSWRYLTPPLAPDLRWQNWDGFQVTRYSLQLRNEHKND